MRRLKTLAQTALSLLYPDHLACCGCAGEADVTGGLCRVCAEHIAPQGLFAPPQPLRAAYAAYRYEPPLSETVHRLKYEGQTYLARFIAGRMALPWPAVNCLVPVPLHKKRLRERGFNQAERIARHLSARVGTPLRADLLSRTRYTVPQITLDGLQRQENVRGAFTARPCDGLSVALLDDVVTTGGTMTECARALLAAGAKEVYALAFLLAV